MDYVIYYEDEYWDTQRETTCNADQEELISILQEIINRWDIIICIFHR